MAVTQIRGSTQIIDGTITAAKFVSSLGLATSQLADGAEFIKRNGSVTFTGSINLGGFTATNAGAPSSPGDLVTKSYADALISGFHLKFARVVSTTNLTLSGLQTIDGVSVSANDLVLLTGQSTGSQNGLWAAQSGSWTRPAIWAAASVQTEGTYVILEPDGTTYGSTKWFSTNTGSITVDTTASTWSQDTSGTTYTNGNGISLTGNVFAVKVGNGVEFDGSNNVQVKQRTNGLVTVTSGGVGIPDGTAAQVILADASNHPVWTSVSGDVTINSSGVTAVNHTAGSGFLKYGDIVVSETPSGSVNGSNTAFSLANTPQNSSVQLFFNGQLMEAGAGNDYTISGTSITMLFTPQTGDKIRAVYIK